MSNENYPGNESFYDKRSYGFLITKELIFGFQTLDLTKEAEITSQPP